jgi:glycosyltransferase involved in cell wall biosynthesis
MRVAISTLIVRPGRSGSNETYLVNLIDALARIDNQNEYLLFVTPQNRHRFESVFSARFRPVVMPDLAYRRPVRAFFDQFIVPIIAATRGVTVLHYPGTIGSILKLRCPRTVVTIHYDVDNLHAPSINLLKRFYFDALFSASCGAASQMIVPSKVFKQKLAAHWRLPLQRLSVVYHGVKAGTHFENISMLLDKYGIQTQYLLAVTNSLPHKNLFRILEAFALIKQRWMGNCQLVLVGDIAPHLVRTLCANAVDPRLRVPDQDVIILGYLQHDEVIDLYAHATLLLNPSLTESSSMTVLEAAANGVPVVASDIPVHREILGAAGVFVDPYSSVAIADACVRLMQDTRMRSALVEAGLEKAAPFTWERTAYDTLAVYAKTASVDPLTSGKIHYTSSDRDA